MGDRPLVGDLIVRLQKCRQKKDLGEVQRLHALSRAHDLDTHIVLGNYLVPALANCGALPQAQALFNRLPTHNEYSWSSLIFGYIDDGDPRHALLLYHCMLQDHVQPSTYIYVGLLKACALLDSVDRGRCLYSDIVKQGSERHLFIGNTLVDMYCKCGLLVEAQDVFNRLPLRDAVTWTALILGYAEHGYGVEALSCFERMQLEGIPPDDVTLVCSLKACSSLGIVERGWVLSTEIVKRALEKDLYVGSTMVDMCAKCGALAEAQKVFDHLPARNVVSWTALIGGYADQGFGDEALACIEKMQQENVTPVTVTFASCLKACGVAGVIEKGHEIHAEVAKREWDRDPLVANTLVDMYGKCGSLAEGRKVFDRLSVKCVVSWTAMISGFGENHDGEMAIECFQAMQEQGVKPNALTFSCILAACSHSSLVVEGQEYFKSMTEKYGIKPTVDHYTCVVDLLARSGQVYEAERFVKAMQCPPSLGIVRALLSACKFHGEIDLGLRCFQQLVHSNQDDAVAYLMMADIYASAGRWGDANRIQGMRADARAQKKLANASIVVNTKVLEFAVGENHSKGLLGILSALNIRTKDEGHVPNVDVILMRTSDKEQEGPAFEFVDNAYLPHMAEG